MYRAPDVMDQRAHAAQVVRDLFPLYLENTGELPGDWQADLRRATTDHQRARHVADYIAGMTDRFALQEHARLKGCVD